jgi:hypothetical protein
MLCLDRIVGGIASMALVVVACLVAVIFLVPLFSPELRLQIVVWLGALVMVIAASLGFLAAGIRGAAYEVLFIGIGFTLLPILIGMSLEGAGDVAFRLL